MLKLLSPYYLSGIPVQIMLGVQSFLVSLLPAGFASIFFYARRIVDYIEQFSVNIFSQLMLPYFTKKIAQFSLAHIRKTYNQLIYLTNYTHLPILILIATFGRQLINILFTSKFTSPEIITKLGITFSAFILFYLPEPSNDVQSNVILSLKKTMWLNLVNISRMVITIFLSIVLFKYFAFWAIIFSYAISSLQGFIINQWYLRKQCAFENIFINPRFWKIIFLNIALAIFCMYLNKLIYVVGSVYVYQRLMLISAACLFAGLFYIFASYLSKNEELKILLSLVKKS